ncbi:6-bladed beta-propeller [Viscerimonas tarda]
MKNQISFIWYIIIFISFISCNNKNMGNVITSKILSSKSLRQIYNADIITIDNTKSEIASFSQRDNKLKDIKYIPLISGEPIGIIDKIVIYKDQIFVLDAYKSEKVFIFNMDGELLNTIDSKGAGPEEYRGLKDMNISKAEDCLLLNDRLSLQMLYFSLDGKFLKKTKKIANGYFAIFDDKIVNQLSFGQSYDPKINYHIVISKNDSVIGKGFPFYPLQNQAVNPMFSPLQYNFKNELLFCPNLSDTIYQIINDSSYTAKYVVNHKKSIWTKKDDSLTTEEYLDLIRKSGYTHLVAPILETENFVSYQISYEMLNMITQQTYWYDKREKKSFAFENTENIKICSNIIPEPISTWGNHYVGLIRPEVIELERNFIKESDWRMENKILNELIMKDVPNLEGVVVLYEFN